MTTIRKIVTSKIDGDSANNTNTSEIRPSNETAFYLDTSGNTDKLTLMMFDGVRTHLKSKVLAPGRLYGSDADAGDNSGSDTIKLIPDATLHYNGSDQYLIIDPTGGEPGHIHIRAGGTQDSSGADLYLGGELTCVRVSDTSDSVTIRTTNIGDPNITMDWSFQPDGNLYFPGIGNNRIGESEPGLVVSSDASVVLQSNNTGESAEWYFGADGNLTLPNSITMGPGSGRLISVVTPAPGLVSWEFGMDGNLTVPGNINYANGVSILSGLGGADFSNVSLIGTAGNLTIQAPSPSNTATVTNENGSPGGPGSNIIAAQSLYSPSIGLVQPGWTVTGNNLTTLTTVTNVSGPDEFGAYTITTDTTETDPFWYNDVYTFTTNTPAYSNLVISSGNFISGYSGINFVLDSSGDGEGYSTIELVPDVDRFSSDQYLIVDPTAPGHIHIRAGGAQDNSNADLIIGGENSHIRVTAGSNPPVYIQANSASWMFGVDSSLSMPTGGNLYFDSSAVSVIDGVTNITASGTVGANVIQVLSDLTSFGASPAPRIYGFSSIATTGSAVNEGNISASGNLVASQNAYVTGNIFAAQYNFANGVNILTGISGGATVAPLESPPGDLSALGGDLWFDSTNQQLKVYSGSAWITVGPLASPTTGNTGAFPAIMIDTVGSSHTVTQIKISGVPYVIISPDDFNSNLAGFASIKTGMNFSTANTNSMSGLANVSTNSAYISGNVITGNVVSTGNVTASNFIGNISITGNVQGTSPSVQLVAGSYTATFDNTGVLTLPTIGGDEGGEINFGAAATNTTLVGPVKLDVYQDRVRFFEGNTKGAYIDLSQAATGVGTLLNNRVSAFVDAGTFVTMDNIKATVTTSGNRGLSLATVSGSYTYSIGGTYGAGVGTGGASTTGTLTTTPTASIFGWGFTATGDIATYIITNTSSLLTYRITVQIGASFLNNSIIIERLI